MTLWTINGEPFHPDRIDAELLVHFDGFRGRYVFHCHNLEHEEMQMMGNFEVT